MDKELYAYLLALPDSQFQKLLKRLAVLAEVIAQSDKSDLSGTLARIEALAPVQTDS